jgi:hypothetical protein
MELERAGVVKRMEWEGFPSKWNGKGMGIERWKTLQ